MRIFSVSDLSAAVKHVLESEFPFVWVQGQVGNVSRPASGHLYFTLRDERAVINVVWFKGAQRPIAPGGVDPVTGEVLEAGRDTVLDEGQEVLCAGRINVYEPRGAYQLVAELVQEKGVGELALKFEALKRDLAARGWFDAARKRPLPRHPDRVAVVTSPRGAAIRDFLRLSGERGWGAHVRVIPAVVQGEAAPASVASAMALACADGWPEVVVLVRGGGSLEDLWAFNTESVAEAVFNCPVPVVCGVGHEVDVTIADMVADVRAATPSHAAQLLWPEREGLMQAVDDAALGLETAFGALLRRRGESLAGLERALLWLSPGRRVDRWLEAFGREALALATAGRRLADERSRAVDLAASGLLRTMGPQALAARSEALEGLTRRLALSGRVWLRDRDQSLALAGSSLAALDPAGPLERGYSLVRSRRTGRFLRSVAEAKPGDALDIRVVDGAFGARVESVTPDSASPSNVSSDAHSESREKDI